MVGIQRSIWWRGAGWLLFVAGAASWILAFLFDSPPYVSSSDQVWAISFFALLIVGLFLSIRVPDNAFGWMVLVAPGLVGAGVAGFESGNDFLGDQLFGLGALLGVTALYFFPDGRLPARFWRGVWASGAMSLMVVARLVGADWRQAAESLGLGLIVVGAIGSMAHRAVAGSPITRRQIGLPLFVIILGISAGFLLGSVASESDWTSVAISLIITIGVPVALAVSVMRYRLYEIDRIISRTLSYALVVVVLGVLFFGTVTLVTSLLPAQNSLAVAGATLLVAALFNPLRRRLQLAVDRRFNRSGYKAEAVSEEFATKLREPLTTSGLVKALDLTVNTALQPQATSIWIRQDSADSTLGKANAP